MRVTGKVEPVIENPVPASVAELTVTAVVPEEVSVSVLVEAVSRFTLPKAREVALTVSCGATPVPVRPTVLVPPTDALLEKVILPLSMPAEVGSKLT